MIAFRQGEIYLLKGYNRPVVVVSREELNRGKYILGIPTTSAQFESRRLRPSCVAFRRGEFGFTADCVAQAELLSAIPTSQVDSWRGPIGKLDSAALRNLVRAVGHVLESLCTHDGDLGQSIEEA